jgi:pimeloyl-ACP methyl ester carboxylesterase
VPLNGVTLFYEEAGNGQPLVFIHGFPFDHRMWWGQLGAFPGWRCIAPDLRGLGLSEAPPDPTRSTIATHADDLARMFDHLGIARAVIAGLSMGGYVVFEFWRRYRDRCRALILCNTRSEADTTEGKEQRDRVIQAIGRRGSEALIDIVLWKVLSPETLAGGDQVLAQVRLMISESPPNGTIAAARAMRDRQDSSDLLGSITLPTLILAGAEDALISADSQRRLAERISGARIEIVSRAGHLAPLEQPEAFNRIVQRFLDSLR